MRKSLFVLIALLFLVPTLMFAQELDDVNWATSYNPGNLNASAGVGWVASGIGVQGGVELFLAEVEISDTLPLDFGVAGRAGVGLDVISDIGINLGALGTAHLTFGELDVPEWLKNIDLYIGLGLGFASDVFFDESGGLGIATMGGVNYYLSDSLALYSESTYLGRWWSDNYTFGLTLRL